MILQQIGQLWISWTPIGMKMILHLFIEIGSCELHVVHDAFKAGVITTN